MTRWRSTASLKRKRAGELGQGLLVGLDVQQQVVGLVHLGQRIGQLATAPVLDPVHGTARAAVTMPL